MCWSLLLVVLWSDEFPAVLVSLIWHRALTARWRKRDSDGEKGFHDNSTSLTNDTVWGQEQAIRGEKLRMHVKEKRNPRLEYLIWVRAALTHTTASLWVVAYGRGYISVTALQNNRRTLSRTMWVSLSEMHQCDAVVLFYNSGRSILDIKNCEILLWFIIVVGLTVAQ